MGSSEEGKQASITGLNNNNNYKRSPSKCKVYLTVWTSAPAGHPDKPGGWFLHSRSSDDRYIGGGEQGYHQRGRGQQ